MAGNHEAWKTDVDFLAEVVVRQELGEGDGVRNPLYFAAHLPAEPFEKVEDLYNTLRVLEADRAPGAPYSYDVNYSHNKAMDDSELASGSRHVVSLAARLDSRDFRHIDDWLLYGLRYGHDWSKLVSRLDKPAEAAVEEKPERQHRLRKLAAAIGVSASLAMARCTCAYFIVPPGGIHRDTK